MNAKESVVLWTMTVNPETEETVAWAECPECYTRNIVEYGELWRRHGLHGGPIAECECGHILYFDPMPPEMRKKLAVLL